MVAYNQAHRPEGVLFLQPFNIEQYHDDEGRPLKENKAPESCRNGVPMELSECHYAGSRYRHAKPMNVSALRQMVKHWPEVIAGFHFLRNVFAPRRPAGEVSFLDFWKIARAGSLIPSFLIYRADDPLAERQIPAFVAAIYKASLGLFDTAQQMALAGILTGEYSKNTLADPYAIFDFSDKEEILVGKKEVCAGPENLILESMEAIVAGGEESSDLESLLRDAGQFESYVTQEHILYLLNFTFPLISYPALADLFKTVRNHGRRLGESRLPIKLFRDLVEIEKRYPHECRSLEAIERGARDHYIKSLFAFLEGLDIEDQICSLLKAASDMNSGQRQEFGHLIQRLIDDQPIDDAAKKALAEGLASYLILEKRRLKLHTLIQSKANAALNREPVPRALTGLDLSRAFGKTVRDALAGFFSLEIKNTPDETVIQRLTA